MYTDLGEIKILINRREVSYESIELVNCNHYFSVKKRFKLICNIPKHLKRNINIACKIEIKRNAQVKSGPETGENLALISFYWEKSKLSIGTRGDIQGVKYNYLDNSIGLIMPQNPQQIIFYVAWLEMLEPAKEDIYTWLAADPKYDD